MSYWAYNIIFIGGGAYSLSAGGRFPGGAGPEMLRGARDLLPPLVYVPAFNCAIETYDSLLESYVIRGIIQRNNFAKLNLQCLSKFSNVYRQHTS